MCYQYATIYATDLCHFLIISRDWMGICGANNERMASPLQCKDTLSTFQNVFCCRSADVSLVGV